jgi:leader peptidase (prepilin peptidase)/N-methyltransferase
MTAVPGVVLAALALLGGLVGALIDTGLCQPSMGRSRRRATALVAGTSVMFAAFALRFGTTAQLPAYLFLLGVGVAAAAIELDERPVPDSVVLPAYVIGPMLLMPAGASNPTWLPAGRALAGMLALGAIYFALIVAFPTGMGLGDVKLAGFAGVYLGWLSWAAVLIGAVGSLVLVGVIGGGVAKQPRHRIRAAAFGASVVAAAVIAVFVAVPLDAWYGSLVTA